MLYFGTQLKFFTESQGKTARAAACKFSATFSSGRRRPYARLFRFF